MPPVGDCLGSDESELPREQIWVIFKMGFLRDRSARGPFGTEAGLASVENGPVPETDYRVQGITSRDGAKAGGFCFYCLYVGRF
jgi:hypothetical protein